MSPRKINESRRDELGIKLMNAMVYYKSWFAFSFNYSFKPFIVSYLSELTNVRILWFLIILFTSIKLSKCPLRIFKYSEKLESAGTLQFTKWEGAKIIKSMPWRELTLKKVQKNKEPTHWLKSKYFLPQNTKESLASRKFFTMISWVVCGNHVI